MKKLLPILVLITTAGCFTRDTTRYGADGKPWARDRTTAFMIRGEASQIREHIKETAHGDYERTVSVGKIAGETETDKISALIDAAVSAGVKAAAKSLVPIPVP